AMAAQGSPGGRRRRPALVAIDGAGDASAREVTGPATADDRGPDGTDAAGAAAGAAAGTGDAERRAGGGAGGRSPPERARVAGAVVRPWPPSPARATPGPGR